MSRQTAISPVVLVFCKEPAPGRAKTRLGRVIGHERVTGLAWALLEDTLRLAGRVGVDLVVVHAPPEPSPALRDLVARVTPGASLEPQSSGDLGQRLHAGLSGRRSRPRVALGSDAPDLPPGRIEAAFAALESAQAVLGPAEDGGYYLIGLGAGVGSGFLAHGIRWSAPTTLHDTRAQAEAAGLRVGLLPSHRDVDDLPALRDLARRAGIENAPATFAWLERHHDDVLGDGPRGAMPSNR